MPIERSDHVAYIGLGSNVGDRRATLEGALAALGGSPGVRVVQSSRLRLTPPVGGPAGQDDYLNGAVVLRTPLDAHDLLDVLLAIESRFGRRRLERWGPRTLDLDLLLYDDAVIDSAHLTVPHPRMHERRFVLEPLCDLAPEAIHPSLGLTARELLDRLP